MILAWKLGLICHYFTKKQDAELCEEMQDSIMFNLETASGLSNLEKDPLNKIEGLDGQAVNY